MTVRRQKRPSSTKKKRRYVVVIESGPRNFGAYVPDLPGCVSTGKTLAEVRRNIREAMAFHIESMERDGDPIPEPTAEWAMVEV